MIGITKEGQLIEITNLSSLTGVKLVGVLVTDSNDLNPDYLNISNHFSHKGNHNLIDGNSKSDIQIALNIINTIKHEFNNIDDLVIFLKQMSNIKQ